MKKLLTALVLSMILFGCSTSIPVQMTVPPNLNYGGARTIGVIPFTTSSEDASEATKDLRYYFSWYNSRALHDDLKLASALTSKVESVLASSDYFTVISTEQLQQQAANGTITAEAVVTGKIASVLDDYNKEYNERTDADGNTTKVPEYTREAQITVVFKILSASDLTVLDTIEYTVTAKDTANKYEALKSKEAVRFQAIDRIVNKVTYDLIPKTYTEYRTMAKLENDKDPRVERINDLIKGDFYQEAYDLYMEIYSETSDFAALYNAILLTEVMGDYDKALDDMTQLAKTSGDKRAIAQMNRMKKQKADREALGE
ncbi:putative periplasmic lipoprotein [Sediminispirochaeta smaragdinae]|uniref:Lipoprotein n=1 Tax=Sediminispirochaeta smaragdinae (strain DSM 11293 / JCM 15392 / SEBR 4228) TaxID=573413 RepID=E1R8D9_SEDSS|nr:hypothetical protein [Sediminispirochaeta smaragdinae]ADK79283.1 hypothetical protein Spirs_0126 [Sediminispirochaeta smaragdinae DSM 11293]